MTVQYVVDTCENETHVMFGANAMPSMRSLEIYNYLDY